MEDTENPTDKQVVVFCDLLFFLWLSINIPKNHNVREVYPKFAEQSSHPVSEKQVFMHKQIFNYFTGQTDRHAVIKTKKKSDVNIIRKKSNWPGTALNQ